MTKHLRRSAVFCGLLFVALLVNAVRVQLPGSPPGAHHPGDRRALIAQYAQPRGDILAGGRPVTGSRDSHGQLRYERTYRAGPLYAAVTGRASQAYGTSGLERAVEPLLTGTDPRLAEEPWWHRLLVRAGLLRRGPLGPRGRGGQVVTTLDPAAQRAGFTGLGHRRGAVAAVEPATGRVLALVSTPSYDPEELSSNGSRAARAWLRLISDPRRPLLNRAVSRVYPPGSTFKVVTAAAALDSGVVRDPDAPTRTPAPYRLPGTATDLTNETDGCARASLREAFTRSCNTVFADLGVQVGRARMAAAARAFGFDAPPPRIPLAVAPSRFGAGTDRAQLALASIGQFNTRATPLQMATVAAAVADGGRLRTPYLVERATTHDGRPLPAAHRPPARRAMTPATARTLRSLMTDTVAHGTARRAALPGATVGGKTGTAEHAGSGPPYAWFVSWARAEGAKRPAVAVAVVVEEPGSTGGPTAGGALAAPIAREVMRAVLRH